MKRMFRLSVLVAFVTFLFSSSGIAQQPQVQVSGRIAPGDVRIFVKDSTYLINKDYVVGGTLIIEPGTTILFHDNGRLIDSTGGRIIADGFAEADYNSNPHGFNPLGIAGSTSNPNSWTGFGDLNYATFDGVNPLNPGATPVPTVDVKTNRDVTVHSSKYHYVYNVVLNLTTRMLSDLNPMDVASINADPNRVIIPFETALMLRAARMTTDISNDVNLNVRPWARIGGKNVNIEQAPIRFVGQVINNVSREWGHIVILPGARAAFFRNATFEDMKKDTTVDRFPVYQETSAGANWNAVNESIKLLSNGSGGAITTFSSRTWLLDVTFKNNRARYRGGALQILEAPDGLPTPISRNNLIGTVGAYASNKNPNITNRDGSPSTIVQNFPIAAIDRLDESGSTEPLTDYQRMGHDDARLAVYLGRMRNMTFENNTVQLANVGLVTTGNPPVVLVSDLTDEPAKYPQIYGNVAYGGAVYISGNAGSENRRMEIGFGINNSILIDGTEVEFDKPDSFIANNNRANNYQSHGSTFGARGGAVYVGKYTSFQIAGHFENNRTYAKFLEDEVTGSRAGLYSMGGAVYVENSLNRLFIKGGPDRESIANETRFIGNISGSGGAVYVDGNSEPQLTTIIGGSDATLNTRDFGFDIVFAENRATAYGGAVFSKRQGTIHGAGGVNAGDLIGYGGKYPIRFENNTAGYAGGAVAYDIPNADILPYDQRAVQIVRAMFTGNTVGMDVEDKNIDQVAGGGAVYALNADLNLVKAVEFSENMVYNGNGGAIAMVEPYNLNKRFFVTDLDEIAYDSKGVAVGMSSTNDVFVWDENPIYPADSRMLTRFKSNQAIAEERAMDQMGTGTTQRLEGTVERTRNQFLSTDWVSAQTGYAVGMFGTVVKFTEGGDTWTHFNSGTTHRLTSVEFVNANKGFVAGAQGIMLRTDNSGNSWTTVPTGTLNKFNDINFVGETYGYAVTDNGLLYYTTNGGNTWATKNPQPTNLNGVYFSSQNVGYIVGDSKLIIRTNDGGDTWEEVVPPIPNYNLRKVTFVSVDKGFIVGDNGIVLVTEDGGDSWSLMNSGVTAHLTDIHFISQNNGFITTVYGDIIHTNDGGATWTVNDISKFGLHSIYFASSSVGYAVGDYGTLLKTVNGGASWSNVDPVGAGMFDVTREHPYTSYNLPENGIGLGGALYILDQTNEEVIGRTDTINFNRVRLLDNHAYTGAAIYSDNYDLKLVFGRSLISQNHAHSDIGVEQNAIYGPVVKSNPDVITANEASSDLASAVIYGEVQGPLPSYTSSEAANSIYDNHARFLIRLPDAPTTKGILAGRNGVGLGGTDTLRGNYWGQTEANVNLVLSNDQGYIGAINETFFIDGDGTSPLPFIYGSSDPIEQGPFESMEKGYTYIPVPLMNDASDENTPAANSINEKLLMSGKIYDLYDKGTDIKTADYSNRRMSPIEDFAVGIPPIVNRFDDDTQPSNGKYVRRMIRDPFCVDKTDDNGDLMFPYLTALQSEWQADPNTGEFYHPIGLPLYLETTVDYDGLAERSNHIPETANETVFFVINETTGDFVRANMRQVSEVAPYRETFRAMVELVPDSSNRRDNTLFRRTTEGLFNFGVGFSLLAALEDNPYNEDGATLLGRKYENNWRLFGKVPNIFDMNRPRFDDVDSEVGTQVTYFAGERYRALPVDTGDVIRVVSRTVLWKEGVVPAFDEGITFKIRHSTLPPEFTGDIVSLRGDTLVKLVPSADPVKNANAIPDTIYMTEYLNTIFITEDRVYPQPNGTYNNDSFDPLYRGRDSILAITAMDTNNFYDPRALADGDNYTYLTYEWDVQSNSGLANWLQADTLYASNPLAIKDNAVGHVVFKGIPVNPYVVPGGERVYVRAKNYPPHYRTIDSLKASGLFSDEQIAKFIETFGPYYNASSYDVARSRYLQQDTINAGSQYTADYEFRIFVVDSVPLYFDENYAGETLERFESDGVTVIDTIAVYEPTVLTCDRTGDGKLRANLTDKLRFQIDINTDDEAEDLWAEREHGWDFRYGRTAYGFQNYIISGGDTVLIDSTTISNEDGEFNTYIGQSRPTWMSDQYMYRYDDETTLDEFAADFTTFGQLNYRIDRVDAITLLTPLDVWNDALNTDTTFTVVVNDGHGGRTNVNFDVFINVAPEIRTNELPPAKEGRDYNTGLTDTIDNPNTRTIEVFDPNFDQTHTYELIYEGRGDIPKDPCYEDAGFWREGIDYGSAGFTPAWLKINEESGKLYGTPRVTDARKNERVIVLVTDEDGLPALKEFDLFVDSTSHRPFFAEIPDVECIDPATSQSFTVNVSDFDLLRDPEGDIEEVLTITVVNPAQGITVTPSQIFGHTVTSDTVELTLTTSETIANVPRDPDGRITVTLRVVDGSGNEAFKSYRFRLSDDTYFVAPITVTNNLGAFQVLEFGTAIAATSGDGNDGNERGILDPEYCEYELPPFPQQDVFEARWTIPTINGIYRNIYPEAVANDLIYVAQIQPGGESGQTALNYPVTIEWNMNDIPAQDDNQRNPSGSTWYIRDAVSNGAIFNANMRDASIQYSSRPKIEYDDNTGDVKITLDDADLDGFIIYRDVLSDVATNTDFSLTTSINRITPNPVQTDTKIEFSVAKTGLVTIDILDNLGNVVANVVNATYTPGEHNVMFDKTRNLTSGSYSLRLSSGAVSDVQKIIIVK